VLIVDDSVVARAVLSRLLSEHSDIDVVGQAGSAASAYKVLEDKRVDIILLDIEMPGINGLAALPELIRVSHGARVLIVSSAAADGAEATITALRQGAADTLLKPSAAQFTGRFADELVDRLRRIARPGDKPHQAVVARFEPPAVPATAAARRLECLGIGSSTGGVHALARFFGALPKSFSTPILVTQHLPSPFMPYFVGQLEEMSGRPTRLGAPGLQPQPGEILLAPGDAHMTLMRTGPVTHVRLERKRAVSGCMPSVDPMLASIGKIYGVASMAVILSGMGRDGLIGAGELKEAGGTVLAQDEATSVVWGMPGAVTNAGLTRAVLPPDQLARRIAEWSEGDAAWK
jgi:two-component system chemotaxis response regulator CheB